MPQTKVPPSGLPCANWSYKADSACPNEGKFKCRGCQMVTYCSAACQKAHWKIHKTLCKDKLMNSEQGDPFNKEAYLRCVLTSQLQSRIPEKMDYFYGNSPALSLYSPKVDPRNIPGLEKEPMRILLAASGDMRHLLQTMASLPEKITRDGGGVEIYLNDYNPYLTLRTNMMLMYLHQRGEAAIDAVIDFWYSVSIDESNYWELLGTLMDFDALSEGNMETVTLYKGGMFGTRDADVARIIYPSRRNNPENLTVKSRMKGLPPVNSAKYDSGEPDTGSTLELCQLLDMVHAAHDHLNPVCAHTIPEALKLRSETFDVPDARAFGYKYRRHFQAMRRYADDGVMLPAGASRLDSQRVVNMTLFRTTGEWENVTCDPIRGWDPASLEATGEECKVPENDLHGKLFCHVRKMLKTYIKKFRHKTTVKVISTAFDFGGAVNYFTKVCPRTFDVIFLSNALDEDYTGTRSALELFSPLLNPNNPNALITGYYMNWAESADVANQEHLRPADLTRRADPAAIIESSGNMPSLPLFRLVLRKNGALEACRRLRMQIHTGNNILVPSRQGCAIGAPSDALPGLFNYEYQGQISFVHYVEFTRAGGPRESEEWPPPKVDKKAVKKLSKTIYRSDSEYTEADMVREFPPEQLGLPSNAEATDMVFKAMQEGRSPEETMMQLLKSFSRTTT